MFFKKVLMAESPDSMWRIRAAGRYPNRGLIFDPLMSHPRCNRLG